MTLRYLARVNRVTEAIEQLKAARDNLRATSPKAADYVARALKSAEGALRHARHMERRYEEGDTPRHLKRLARAQEVQS